MAGSIPDSVWLQILSYLSADNLLLWTNLTQVERDNFALGHRLFHLCGDKELWQKVNWRGGNVKPIVLRKLIRFLGPHTETICLEGSYSQNVNKKKQLCIPESFLHSVQSRCTRLKEIVLVNCTLDYYETPLKKLPASVEKIVLHSVHWTNLPIIVVRTLQSSPFFKLKKRFKNLKSVEVRDGDRWLSRQDRNCLNVINLQNE